MARKRQVKYESLTIRQAYHKNSAEDAQLGVVLKFLRQEQAYAELEQVGGTTPVSIYSVVPL